MKRVWLLVTSSFRQYGEDNASLLAAAISYYVLFSIIPLAIFSLSAFGFVVRDRERQEDIAAEIVDAIGIEAGDVSIAADEAAIDERYGAGAGGEVAGALDALAASELERLASSLDEGEPVQVAGRLLGGEELTVTHDNVVVNTLRGVSRVSGALGLAGLVGVAWSASGMFGAVRRSLNVVWGTDRPRPFVQQKLFDLGMVASLGLLLGLSIAGTAALRTIREVSDDALGPLSTGTGLFWSVLPFLLPAAVSFAAFVLLYRYVPAATTSFRDVWPGALLAAALFETMKNLFAFYVAKFNNYDVAYGALGGVLLFMLWTYLTASIMLFGAELAAEYQRLRAGGLRPEPAGFSQPLGERAKRAVRGLFVRQ